MQSLFILAATLASLFTAQIAQAARSSTPFLKKSFQPELFCKKLNSIEKTSHQFTSNKASLTTLTVTLSTDNNPGGIGEIGDLRYALNTLNQSLNTTPDDFAITFAFPMTIQLNGILPIINNSANPVNITIGNSGSIPTVTIDGNSAYPGFFIPTGNVTVQNIIFQNLLAKGGNGGDGISGGGGGMGAGAAIYAPQTFLNGSNPTVTLINVSVNNSSAVGGNGGNYFALSATGNEGGGGGGGFSGNGGSVTVAGITGGAGGGGFGGNGGNVTLSTSDLLGGGGGGGGGIGSLATLGTLTNLGHGGSDQEVGFDGSAYGLTITAGSGGGGLNGGNLAGGGGGGAGLNISTPSGGGGGGSLGQNGLSPQGSIPPFLDSALPSGGSGGDGAGGGGGAIVNIGPSNQVDGKAAAGGYGGGGGGAAGIGGYDIDYSVAGGNGGVGGGGGGGGVNQSGSTPADGGNSLGGGGGSGGGPSNGINAPGGTDVGSLGGGAGGSGANNYGASFGGGGGGGGSALGGAIFIDTNLNFNIDAISGTPTTFNTTNNTVTAGTHGTGGPGGSDGSDGSALGNNIFLRSGSSLTFNATDTDDVLTLGEGVSFIDDTTFGGSGTSVYVRGKGSVIYNGTTDYQGTILNPAANFKVNGTINSAQLNLGVCAPELGGILSGNGTLSGDVYVLEGTIYPDTGETLTLGSLTLNSESEFNGPSVVHSQIDSSGTSLVAVTGAVSLAGTLNLDVDLLTAPGSYTLLTSSGITGTFDNITFNGATPNYTLQYLPEGAPTYVQFNLISFHTNTSTAGNGTFTGGSGPVSFKAKASRNTNNEITASLSYNDPGAGIHFDNPVVTSLIFSGNDTTMSGTVYVNNQKVNFTFSLTAGSPDHVSITMSNGYSASGNLTSGDIVSE